MALEHLLQIKDIEVPPDDALPNSNYNGNANKGGDLKKYTQHEIYHIEGDNDDLPL